MARNNDSRVVQAETDTHELVRYDRMGKYYIEAKDQPRTGGTLVTLAEAVDWARRPGCIAHARRPGGLAFDAKYRKAAAALRGDA